MHVRAMQAGLKYLHFIIPTQAGAEYDAELK